MLTVAEETLGQLAAEHGKDVSTHLFGQEINAETYAICTADLLLKGEGEAADNIVGGPEHSTLANDAKVPFRPGSLPGRNRVRRLWVGAAGRTVPGPVLSTAWSGSSGRRAVHTALFTCRSRAGLW